MFLQLKGLKKIYEEEKGLKNLDLEIEEVIGTTPKLFTRR